LKERYARREQVLKETNEIEAITEGLREQSGLLRSEISNFEELM
jgi:hypothetical protein